VERTESHGSDNENANQQDSGGLQNLTDGLGQSDFQSGQNFILSEGAEQAK
jgi:hypothetical protein